MGSENPFAQQRQRESGKLMNHPTTQLDPSARTLLKLICRSLLLIEPALNKTWRQELNLKIAMKLESSPV